MDEKAKSLKFYVLLTLVVMLTIASRPINCAVHDRLNDQLRLKPSHQFNKQNKRQVYETEQVTRIISTATTIPIEMITKEVEHENLEITDNEGNRMKVLFPEIHTTYNDFRNGTLAMYFDTEKNFEGILYFQIIVVTNGGEEVLGYYEKPITYKATVLRYEDSIKHNLKIPYIAGQFAEFPSVFILGDGLVYGGFYNGPLLLDQQYGIRVRAIVKNTTDESIQIDTDEIEKIETRTSNNHVISSSLGGCLAVAVILLLACSVNHLVRKRKEDIRSKETIARFKILMNTTRERQSTADQGHVRVASEVFTSGSEWWSNSMSSRSGEGLVHGEDNGMFDMG